MSPRWIKMLRDAQATRGRLAMIVLALAASITAVVTMMTAYAVLTREVPRNYISTNPASAQIELEDEVTPELLEQVLRQPNIAMADSATAVLGRIQSGLGDWMPLRLFVVPDFAQLRINTLHPEAGAWPPRTGTMLVERSALPLTPTAIGQSARIELPHSGQRAAVIAGTVHDPGLAPAWQEQTVYGYVTPATLAAWGEPVHMELLKVVVARGGDNAQSIETTVRGLTQWLVANGHPVHEARIPPPRTHPHQSQMSGIIRMLLSFSLLALVLGAILTATIIGGLLAQQVRQIAIMKAVGASAVQIGSLYLGLAAVLGVLALAIGLPAGILAGRGFVSVIGELLNLRIESMVLPGWLFLAAVGLGLVTPLLTALVPIRAAAVRTVKAAIDDHGVSPDVLNSWSGARWLTQLHFNNPAWTVAVRNTFRRRTRLLLTVMLLAGAGAMFLTSLNLKRAWESNVAQAAQDRHFDIELRLQQPVDATRVLAMVSSVPGVARAESWPLASAALAGKAGLDIVRTYPDGGHGGLSLRAATQGTRMIDHHMLQGRWLQDDELNAVVVNSGAHSGLLRDAELGDWVTLHVEGRPVRLRLVGVMRELLTPAAAYVTPPAFNRATDLARQSNNIRLVVDSPDATEGTMRRVVQTLEQDRIGVKIAITEKHFLASESGHVYILVFALGFIASLMAVVGLLGLASALATSVSERTREVGVMRALGASSSIVLSSVIGEGVMIALLSWAISLLVSLLLSSWVGGVLASVSRQDLTLRLSPAAAMAWLAAIVLGALLVSYFPARRAASWSVKKALSHV